MEGRAVEETDFGPGTIWQLSTGDAVRRGGSPALPFVCQMDDTSVDSSRWTIGNVQWP